MGGPRTSATSAPPDMLDHSPEPPAPNEPASRRVRWRVMHILDSLRSDLDLPARGAHGDAATGTTWPYFLVTNDLCQLAFGALKLVLERCNQATEDVRKERLGQALKNEAPVLLDDLLASYDHPPGHEHSHSGGCCAVWHSLDRADVCKAIDASRRVIDAFSYRAEG